MGLLPISRAEVVTEIELELSFRAAVYGRNIAAGKMKRETAEHRVDCLKIELRRIKDGPDFQEFP